MEKFSKILTAVIFLAVQGCPSATIKKKKKMHCASLQFTTWMCTSTAATDSDARMFNIILLVKKAK